MSARKAHILSRIGTDRYYPGQKIWYMRIAIAFFAFAWLNSVATAASPGRVIGASIATGLLLYGVGVWLSTDELTQNQDLECNQCGTELKPTDDHCSFCGADV